MFSAKPIGSTVQIKIPVVATVIQRRGEDGNMCMMVQSPGPSSDTSSPTDTYVFTGNENEIELQETTNSQTEIQYMDERGNVITEEDFHRNYFK